MSTEQPTRHPPEVIEAAHTILSSGRDEARYALAIKRLNEGTSFVNLSRPETLVEASALVLRDALACAEADLASERQRSEKAEREIEIQKTARKDMDRVATIWAERAEKAERELAEARKDTEMLDALLTPAWHPVPKGWPYPDTRGRYDPPYIVQYRASHEDGTPILITATDPINTREKLRQAINRAAHDAKKGGAK